MGCAHPAGFVDAATSAIRRRDVAMSDEERIDLETSIANYVKSSATPKRAGEVYDRFVSPRADRSNVLYAIWRLIDHHQIKLDRDLSLVAVLR